MVLQSVLHYTTSLSTNVPCMPACLGIEFVSQNVLPHHQMGQTEASSCLSSHPAADTTRRPRTLGPSKLLSFLHARARAAQEAPPSVHRNWHQRRAPPLLYEGSPCSRNSSWTLTYILKKT
eukprot:5631684-Amphidinium_carterae.1